MGELSQGSTLILKKAIRRLNMYQDFEKVFNVIYPESSNATYESILNFSFENSRSFQRWYRYKEGFSIDFVQKIISTYKNSNIGIILDPFAGSGTTLLSANSLGYSSAGFEVNPFSFFLMKVKLENYTQSDILGFKDCFTKYLDELRNDKYETYSLPKLSISNKVFQDIVERIMMSFKVKFSRLPESKVKDLIKLGWLACIEELSNYRKAGNGLKIRKTVKPIIHTKDEVIETLNHLFSCMLEDIEKKPVKNNFSIFNHSSLGFSDILGENSVEGIIFSPPYANCFDYTEIYKLELWFGDFVSSYDDLKLLRAKSLKSHLNMKYVYTDLYSEKSSILNEQMLKLNSVSLWDKRIPQMIFGYFSDMFDIIDNCFLTLKKKGFCSIVVGNSAYGGVIIPTDLILAEYAKSIGFTVDRIEVDRYIITSSQQYEQTKKEGKFLRESVVCLVKQ